MSICNKCGKKFTMTSWTRDRFWREFCINCILEFLEESIAKAPKAKRAEFNRE